MTLTAEPQSSPAVDEASVSSVHPHRIRTRFIVAFAIGLLAVLSVGVGALYAYDQQYVGRILPGVRVGDVNVSGLTPEEATARLQGAFGSYSKGQIVLVAGGSRLSLPYAAFHREAAIDSMVQRALAVGRAGSPVERVIANVRTAVRGIVIEPEVRFDAGDLDQWVTKVTAAQQQSPANATVKTSKSGFVVTSAVKGRQADPKTVLAALNAQLARVDAPAEIDVDLQFSDLAPEVTTAEATDAVAAANRIARTSRSAKARTRGRSRPPRCGPGSRSRWPRTAPTCRSSTRRRSPRP